MPRLSYNVRFGLMVAIFVGCVIGIFSTAAITQNMWILGVVTLSLIFVVPNVAAWLLMGESVIQKPEGLKTDEFWPTVEFWALIMLGAATAVAAVWFIPIDTFFGKVALPSVAGIVVWTAGYWKGFRPALLLAVFLIIGVMAWAVFTRPFYGDTLFFPGDPGYEAMIDIGKGTASATGTGFEWKSYVYPTPTHRVRDWADPKVCREHDRFVCGVVLDRYFKSDQGWQIILTHDGTLTWPEGVTDEEAARFLCDLPADEWKHYDRTVPYFIALRAARPSLSPALEAECGL